MDCEPRIVSLCLGVERERRTSAGTNSSDSALQASVSAVSTCVTATLEMGENSHWLRGMIQDHRLHNCTFVAIGQLWEVGTHP